MTTDILDVGLSWKLSKIFFTKQFVSFPLVKCNNNHLILRLIKIDFSWHLYSIYTYIRTYVCMYICEGRLVHIFTTSSTEIDSAVYQLCVCVCVCIYVYICRARICVSKSVITYICIMSACVCVCFGAWFGSFFDFSR